MVQIYQRETNQKVVVLLLKKLGRKVVKSLDVRFQTLKSQVVCREDVKTAELKTQRKQAPLFFVHSGAIIAHFTRNPTTPLYVFLPDSCPFNFFEPQTMLQYNTDLSVAG